MENVEAIIFDLGGVILNIDYNLTSKAFIELGLENFDEIYAQAAQTKLFDDIETGKISGSYFINQLLPFLPKNTSPNKVVFAWNAMILDFPKHRLEFLLKLKNKYKIYLLSNTNEIHLDAVNRSLSKASDLKLNDYFTKVYLSHEIKMRKPHGEIFDFVCKENNLLPQKTLFIDDTIRHIEGAKSIGINAHLLLNEDVTVLLKRIINDFHV